MEAVDKKDLVIGLIVLVLIVGGISYGVKNGYVDLSKRNLPVSPKVFLPTGSIEAGDELLGKVVPPQGVQLNMVLGDIGPQMLEAGVIDYDKFYNLYKSRNSLTQEQINILTKGSDEPIRLDSDSANFLLNFFWAFGLANKNTILQQGPMMKYGGLEGAGKFASTGGWTLAKSDAMDYYSKFEMIVLTDEQQKIVEEVSANIFRPCCNNSTSFPDCNHGMAALGIVELMSARGASADEIYRTIKYFNAYWFSQAYYEMALYFKNIKGIDWPDVDAKTALGFDFSSAQGVGNTRKILKDSGLLKQASGSGGGCGV